MTGLFAFFAAATVGFALVVVFSREIFRAAFGLLGALCGIAVMALLLGSPTVAALQVLIYVGGIFVLFLFAILVTERPGATVLRRSRLGIVAGGALAATLTALIVSAAPGAKDTIVPTTARALGDSLIFENMLVFEIVSVLLLAGLVAAVVTIRKET